VIGFANLVPVAMASVPTCPLADLLPAAREARQKGRRLIALFPHLGKLLFVLAESSTGKLLATSFDLEGKNGWPSITSVLPEAHLFEREIHEETGLVPEGHPWLKAVRRHAELEPPGQGAPPHPFLRAGGEGVHEVAVGPIHAGIIEPGHFRFQCFGEEILHLEIQLGYQMRGAERLLEQGTPSRRLVVAESIAGDTAVGHALAYCSALEALCGAKVPLRAHALRGIALELERLANHVGDLGALCGDVGYLPGLSYFGRLRGDFLNLLMELSGNRFGRGLLAPGGLRRDATREIASRIEKMLEIDERHLRDAAQLAFATPSVLSRFETTGRVSREAAEELGFVGPTARACGLDRDARRDHPLGIYAFTHLPVARAEGGDVMARATVRWLEVLRSLQFVREQVARLPEGPVRVEPGPLRPSSLAVALVEGWRGEIAHVVITSASSQVARHKVIDPSFHNWLAVALSVRGAEVSDFPLCNKSFNLSYAGHDL
jgi:Ni,Fe-hydrogenase III large subunit